MRLPHVRCALMALSLPLAACGARSSLDTSDVVVGCADAAPVCVDRPTGDPCGEPLTVAPTCDASSHAWICPTNAHVLARAATTSARCMPFSDPSTGVSIVGPWGLSSIERVPVGHRCLWIAESATFADGTTQRNIAFEPNLDAPFGTCPTTSVAAPTPIVSMEGADDPNMLVQVDGGYELGGVSHLLYRLFQTDASSPYGVTELGSGIADWDEAVQRFAVPSPSKPFPWGKDLDLGNAVFASPDGTYAFAWGCTGGDGFTSPCRMARIDASDHVELLFPPSEWLPTTNPSGAATLFSSGTWISTVYPTTSGFEHVYIAGFGKTIERDTAPTLTGPWTSGPTLLACDLANTDDNAFCAGPVAHPELADPTRPNEMPISYSVGSTGAMAPSPHAYWPRLNWVSY